MKEIKDNENTTKESVMTEWRERTKKRAKTRLTGIGIGFTIGGIAAGNIMFIAVGVIFAVIGIILMVKEKKEQNLEK